MQFACDYLLLNIIFFIVGVAILVKGSDWFVDAAAALARSFGVPELIIGLTLVSIGTSLPELASSLCAAFYGESNFIIGNIVGSNTANIALILGAGLVLGGGMSFSRQLIWRDMFFLLLLQSGLMAWYYFKIDVSSAAEYGFGRIGGALLLIICVIYSLVLCRQSAAEPENNDDNEAQIQKISRSKAAALIVLALVMITVGAKLMVDTVVWSAVKLGVSDLMISLTIVAVGTSLPELAVTISGILKKRNDIALGNIIGSGIYNILLIIGACAAVSPLTGSGRSSVDSMLIMNGTALLLWMFLLTGKRLHRWQGVIFVALYAAFIAWSIICAR
ncbi:MAG: calcium/sodium antiporter [Lentisphaerae bacterium]|nr:calcium/sodium antiporter [Lentisphaerota bacterium]